jgi:hypothetical protein
MIAMIAHAMTKATRSMESTMKTTGSMESTMVETTTTKTTGVTYTWGSPAGGR